MAAVPALIRPSGRWIVASSQDGGKTWAYLQHYRLMQAASLRPVRPRAGLSRDQDPIFEALSLCQNSGNRLVAYFTPTSVTRRWAIASCWIMWFPEGGKTWGPAGL